VNGGGVPGVLGLDAEELVSCVGCGLCLPHCPTYRVTGREAASPRGRIAAMRAVEDGDAPADDAFARMMLECVQCRGCEAACPSSVPFGHLVEGARAALQLRDGSGTTLAPPWWRRALDAVGYRLLLPRHRLLVAASWVLLVAQRLRLVPRRLGLPRLRVGTLRARLDLPTGGRPDAWLFTGCVMDAWSRDTHAAASRVMRATGARPARPGPGGDCCGALHLHAGRPDEARRLARRVVAAMPGDAPVVVDSAGCGAAMLDYGRLLGTAEAAAFARRVVDFSTWLAARGVPRVRRTGQRLLVSDPCQLRHVQRAAEAVRTVLAPAYELAEIDDDGLCCGAGGAYAAVQPELAGAVRDRKLAAIARAAGGDPDPLVVSANPGCTFHLAAAGVTVRHPAELLAAVLEETGADRA